MRWQGGKGGRVVKWQGEWFLVLFKSGGRRVSLDFIFLLLMLISNGTKEQDGFKIIWHGHRDVKTFLRSNASC